MRKSNKKTKKESPFIVDLKKVSPAEAEKLIAEWLIKSDTIDSLIDENYDRMRMERQVG